ncbi:hypothetical protein FGB62_394g06 [Gracilaria domingensis]|nr:hypothetical protein FGB62_457g017 [Gracilaria domingensis]KAI0556818.1 hypothetical protein FGB62_394g06 [Gracilaria domingensis]
MDEQVVPTFNVKGTAGARNNKANALRRSHTVKGDLSSLARHKSAITDEPKPVLAKVPTVSSTSPQVSSSALSSFVSPAAEYSGKLRWETPLRAGKWRESWEGARELGLPVCVRSAQAPAVSKVIRASVADAVVAYVGPHLPRHTVEKWLCLLFEYLELNADEQVLVVCLLRRYVRMGGRFVGRGDWARPQRWECVVAVASYFAVLLSEEFPGRTAMDLRELLGPNFRFGSEQVSFLKVVDWRISIEAEDFKDVKEVSQKIFEEDAAAKQKMNDWFQIDKASAETKHRAAAEAAAAAAAMVHTPAPTVGKKRSYATIVPADDSVVPRVVIPRLDGAHVHAVPAAPAAFVPAISHWVPHW